MNKKIATLIFLIICLILAGLLLTHNISSVTSGLIFAISLSGLGGLSRGFRKKSGE